MLKIGTIEYGHAVAVVNLKENLKSSDILVVFFKTMFGFGRSFGI